MNEEYAPDYCLKQTLILGCGSIFRGDDGVGSQVAKYLLENHVFPETVKVLDAGSAVGEILFDIALSYDKPEKIVLVDAMDRGLPAGTISVLDLNDLPKMGIKHFSIHQGPSSCLLREFESLGINVVLIAVQPESLPEYLTIGLSLPVQRAFDDICRMILDQVSSDAINKSPQS